MATSWEHLLGGYATNTLTDEEKRQLFEAALNDQTLFDALADEEALKVMLADPEARQRILAGLQTIEHAGVAKKGGKWWDWFRQQSSLAWTGSIAAVGLALIFGWQMEKEWGPVVSQEQEAAKSSSREELSFRTQKPSDERTTSLQKEALETKATQAEPIDGERQLRAKLESDGRESGQAMRRQRGNEQVPQSPPAPSALIQSKDRRPVQPFSVPEAPEVPMADKVPKPTAPGRMAVQAMEEATQSFQSAQELFYAASGSLGDEEIGEKNNNDREDQTFQEGLSRAGKPSPKKKTLTFPLEQDVSDGPAMHTAGGIRYSFVLQTKEGKDEELEIRQVTGNWSEIRLAVEPNVSGYLYVLAPLDKGEWQSLVPMDPEQKKKTEGGIKVKSFQRVEYSLDQLTNPSGKTVASHLVVLLSPTPLNDLGQWLGSEVDMTELLIEREAGAVFAIDPETDKKVPLRVLISLLKFL
ncbi:MAG: hypothetical protein H0W49_03160 [Nitrospirales bacterium]|nr:hypothetical protein [Nitrospirales bacterium]MBA3964473.1 hypothetical protein [Nitrospirales bacterium]